MVKRYRPNYYKKIPPIINAIEATKEMRTSSKREATKKLASTPFLFGEIRQPECNYMIVPRHSSQNRRYIPIGYVKKDIICGDANMLIANSDLYYFGILESNVHMAWMRTVCGRIKSDYRYSSSIVYNNFPWMELSEIEKNKIRKTASNIIKARELYPQYTMSDLYDELLMPPELRKAHQQNDKVVMEAYGFIKKGNDGKNHWYTENECVSALMNMYQNLVQE